MLRVQTPLNNGAWARRGFLCKISNCPFPSILG